MTNLERRLTILEAQQDAAENLVPWEAVDAALERQTAQIRLKLCLALSVDPKDPLMLATTALLAGDTDEQVTRDRDVIGRWRRQEGIKPDTSGVRERITQKLNDVSRRLAEHEPS